MTSVAAQGGWRGRHKIVLVGAVLLFVIVVDLIIFTRRGAQEAERFIDRPDLRAGALMGCYLLRAGPWSFTLPSAPPAGAERSAPQPDSLADVRSTPQPDSLVLAVPDTLPTRLEPPARVVLLPDSATEHGRALPSFRAEAIPGDEAAGRVIRWTVRADTLWLVWSEPGARGGVALFSEGDSLVGWARGVADSIDASAPAVAWPINCSTLGRERPEAAPRR